MRGKNSALTAFPIIQGDGDMDISFFDNLWQSGRAGRKNSGEFWDRRADEFNSHSADSLNDRRGRVIELLESRGMVNDNSSVLDIGCGPGKFAIALSEIAKDVTGIDVSQRMIDFAIENAHRENVKNASFSKFSWEETDLKETGWSKKFDLVFASMCPGINSSETLLKMCEASRGSCYMSSFVKRKDPLREKLDEAVYGKPEDDKWGRGIYSAFNILWLSGYRPEIVYHESRWEKTLPVERAAEIYPHQMDIAEDDIEKIEKIKRVLEQNSVNGELTSMTESTVALMCWRV